MALVHGLLMLKCLALLLCLQLASAQIPSAGSGVIAKPGCQDLCGKVSIPYPFGVGNGCFLEEGFEIKCNNGEPRYGSVSVTQISVGGEMTVEAGIARACSADIASTYLDMGRFTVSNTKNKVILIGCNTYIYRNGSSPTSQECSDCSRNEAITDGSCNGMGCCEASIPPGQTNYSVIVKRFPGGSLINPCIYGFVAEESSFRFSPSYLQDFENNGTGSVPVVVEWTIIGADSFGRCKCGPNTACQSSDDAPGYRCYCIKGYAGNPYLDTSTGGFCQAGSVVQTPTCNGYSGVACRTPQSKSFPRSKFNKIVAGTCVTLSILLVTTFIQG